MGYVVAKYIRLSVEDAKSKSLSIENQRDQLDTYIAGLPQEDIEVLEFIDNGYTGTNLERPGLQEVFTRIRRGEIHCLVVKDFSRLGRDVTDVGYFIEKVFPAFQVRFVSLGDGYDSIDDVDGTSGTDTAFKLIVNELYSKDLSQKIRSSKALQTKMGLYVTKNCAYGYKLDAHRKMVIDPAAAATVRLIFSMALQGKKIVEIGRLLYAEGRPAPGIYKDYKKIKPHDSKFDCVWNKSVIFSILHNEQYTGTYVGGKSAVTVIGSKKAVQKDESEWVKIPGHHPAIISQADFDAVQVRFRERSRRRRKKATGKQSAPAQNTLPLKGMVFCGHCGRRLHRTTIPAAALRCGFSYSAPDIPCHRMSIGEEELIVRVHAEIRKRLQAAVVEGSRPSVAAVPPTAIQARAVQAHEGKAKVDYERFLAGEIDQATFQYLQARQQKEKHRLKIAAAASGAISEDRLPGALEQEADLREIALEDFASPVLTREVADALIEKVLVHPGGTVEIQWKMAALERMPEKVEGMENAG